MLTPKRLALVGAALALGALGATSTAAAATTAHTEAASSATTTRPVYTPTAADVAALAAHLSKGANGTAAPAASCVNPVGVTPALDLQANGSDIGYLYLGYFASCREAYAELHITNSADAEAVAHAEVYIENTVTGETFGDNTTFDVDENGGWADSVFIPIDENSEQDIYYSASPVVDITYDQYHSCYGLGWTHDFSDGSNVWGLDAGQDGNCSNTP